MTLNQPQLEMLLDILSYLENEDEATPSEKVTLRELRAEVSHEITTRHFYGEWL